MTNVFRSSASRHAARGSERRSGEGMSFEVTGEPARRGHTHTGMPLLFSVENRSVRALLKGVLIAYALAMDADAQDRYAADRKAMLEDIARTTRETASE